MVRIVLMLAMHQLVRSHFAGIGLAVLVETLSDATPAKRNHARPERAIVVVVERPSQRLEVGVAQHAKASSRTWSMTPPPSPRVPFALSRNEVSQYFLICHFRMFTFHTIPEVRRLVPV